MITRTRLVPGEPYEPWFDRSPGATLFSAVVLFVVITAVRVALGNDATVGVTMLYLLPVSLVALAWGRWAGLTCGAVAITMLGLWVLVAEVDLSALGWASRAVPLLLTGYLLGDASDRLRRAEEERLQRDAQDLLRRQAVEINDTLVQGMAAAKWILEAGRLDEGIKALDDTLLTGQELVSELIREAGLGVPNPWPGPEAGSRTDGTDRRA